MRNLRDTLSILIKFFMFCHLFEKDIHISSQPIPPIDLDLMHREYLESVIYIFA